MAKFSINPGTMAEKIVESEDFRLIEDYWHFFDEQNETVYVASAKGVNVIERRK